MPQRHPTERSGVPLFGMAIGAASGAAAGAFTDMGADDKFMKALAAAGLPA